MLVRVLVAPQAQVEQVAGAFVAAMGAVQAVMHLGGLTGPANLTQPE
jgi:hypothetical protein